MRRRFCGLCQSPLGYLLSANINVGYNGIQFLDLFFCGVYNIVVDKLGADGITPTALAFVGDAVYTLYVRKRLTQETDLKGGALHLTSSRYVNAAAQAAAYEALTESGILTAEEAEVAHRARNAHVHTHTKAASIADYHRATAMEALVGWLELSGNEDRLREILDACFDFTTAAQKRNG